MTKRGRIATYGSAVALVLAGGVCDFAAHGVIGQVVTMVLIGCGLVILTGLVFMEVGLSEDRERARERGEKERVENELHRESPSPPRARLDVARPPRLRGPRHDG